MVAYVGPSGYRKLLPVRWCATRCFLPGLTVLSGCEAHPQPLRVHSQSRPEGAQRSRNRAPKSVRLASMVVLVVTTDASHFALDVWL